MAIEIQDFQGSSLKPHLDKLAQLRMTVFHDFPYLYEGSLAYEQKYLEIYTRSHLSQVTLAWDGSDLVGATTCLPLIEEVDSLTRPLQQAGFALDRAFYFGESILLPSYRGRGLGREFFRRRHAHAQKVYPDLSLTVFCAVDRGPEHPLRPIDYRPLHDFWRSEGYRPLTGVKAELTWLDRGESQESTKQLTYWLKTWPTGDH